MKKILALALTLVMVLAISLPAFAESSETIGKDSNLPYEHNVDVYVRLDSDGDTLPDEEDPTPNGEDNLNVVIKWSDMQFIYSKTFDEYTGQKTEGWTNDDQYITVENLSYFEVTADFGYTAYDESYDLVFTMNEENNSNATFADDKLTLANPLTAELPAIDEEYNQLPYAQIDVNLADGTVPSVDSSSSIGTITVTLDAEDYEFIDNSDYHSFGGVDGYWDAGESYTSGTVTTDTYVSFYMTSYVYEWDGDESNDEYINYGISEVRCTTNENVMYQETAPDGETYFKFSEEGEYVVEVTFFDQLNTSSVTTKTFTITVDNGGDGDDLMEESDEGFEEMP